MRITSLRHLMHAAETTPWAILPEKLEAIAEALDVRTADGVSVEDLTARAGVSKREAPTYQVRDGVAIVPVFGTIMPRANLMTEMSGGTSAEQLVARVRAAMDDDAVRAVVLDIDSPGGAVSGIPEAGDALYAMRGTKPLIAVANTLAASAAYWLAAQADTIVASPSADVGSVGVYLMHRQAQRYYENAGVSTTVIRAGRYKAEGNPFEPLTDAARAELQARVDDAHEQFVTALARGRNVSAERVRTTYGEGRVLSAPKALAAGMVDRIATLEQVLADLSASAPTGGSDRMPRRRAEHDEMLLATETTAGVESDAALPVLSASGAGPAESDTPPGTITAPQAEETTVSMNATPAPTGATATNDERIARLADLVELRPEAASRLSGWISTGTTYEQAKAELASLAPEPTPTITVGAQRETQRPWESLGHFAVAVANASRPGAQQTDPRLFAAAAGLNQGTPSEGGFAVPGEYSNRLWEGLFGDPSNLLSQTDNYTVEGAFLELPRIKDTDRSGNALFGGVQAYWINEADSLTASRPKFENMRLEPQELAALIPATQKMLDNSPFAIGQYIDRMGRAAIAHRVNQAIISGDGIGKPKGLTTGATKITVAKETGQGAATVVPKNIAKMRARRVSGIAGQYVWLANVDIQSELDDLATVVRNVAGTENVGGVSSPLYNAASNTLAGLPVLYNDHCETLGTEGDLILVHLPSYAVGLKRAGVKTAQSMHLYFDTAQQAFRFMFDIDGQNWLQAPITPAKGSTKSTVITLATRA